jgi:hypothetical protein
VDDQIGSRTIAIPWDKFEHVSATRTYDPQGSMPLRHIVAVALGVKGAGSGSLVIDRIALEPAPKEWGSPWSSSVGRRSLPPWR